MRSCRGALSQLCWTCIASYAWGATGFIGGKWISNFRTIIDYKLCSRVCNSASGGRGLAEFVTVLVGGGGVAEFVTVLVGGGGCSRVCNSASGGRGVAGFVTVLVGGGRGVAEFV